MRQPNPETPSSAAKTSPGPPKPEIKVVREPEPEGLQITWKDGLPDDPFERMQIETGLIAAGLTSKYSAIKRLLDGDDDAAEAEMARMEEEQNQSRMAEAAMGIGMPPPQDAQDAQEMRSKMKAEREAEKKMEKEAFEKGGDKPKRK